MIESHLRYLRVSLTDACNMHCRYCRPKGSNHDCSTKSIDFDRLIVALETLVNVGVRKIRFTGGEPTLYGSLVQVVKFCRSLRDDLELCMTTNGMLLSNLASHLADAGLDSVNVSLDAADSRTFRAITGTDSFDKVLQGIITAKLFLGKVKINTVVMRGINSHCVSHLVELADMVGVDIRFIEFMPSKSGFNNSLYVPAHQIVGSLSHQMSPLPVSGHAAAKYYEIKGKSIRVGLISPVSCPFCAGCDRIRLTTDGHLHHCLFSRKSFDLFQALELSDEETDRVILEVSALKSMSQSETSRFESANLPHFSRIGG